jgi:4-hydroxy-4-methyl-2-oxoglutarate aldolase
MQTNASPSKTAPARHVIFRNIDRPSADYIDRLRKAGATYTLAFAGPLGLGCGIALNSSIRPARPGFTLLGPAFTVLAEDHLMPMYATTMIQPGDVLVIAGGGESDVAIWGGSMTRSALLRRAGGVVVDGKICDSAIFNGATQNPMWDVPVFSRGPAPAYNSWERPGSINVPVEIAGHVVEPGDLVVGGDDGVAVVPKARLREAVEKAEAFQAMVPGWQQGITEGKTWFEVLGLPRVVKKLAVPEFDGPDFGR